MNIWCNGKDVKKLRGTKVEFRKRQRRGPRIRR